MDKSGTPCCCGVKTHFTAHPLIRRCAFKQRINTLCRTSSFRDAPEDPVRPLQIRPWGFFPTYNQRAGTSKNTLHRRWPHRAALAIAAYRQFTWQQAHLPDTGSLRKDILQVLRQAHPHLASPHNTLVHSLLSSIQDDPELLIQPQKGEPDPETSPWPWVTPFPLS